MNIVLKVIEALSFSIGLFGVFIILVGAWTAAIKYAKDPSIKFNDLRYNLAGYLVLGIDFLLCKDVIDTLLLSSGEDFWKDLVGLMTIVTIRIVLTYFIIKEIDMLKGSSQKPKKKE